MSNRPGPRAGRGKPTGGEDRDGAPQRPQGRRQGRGGRDAPARQQRRVQVRPRSVRCGCSRMSVKALAFSLRQQAWRTIHLAGRHGRSAALALCPRPGARRAHPGRRGTRGRDAADRVAHAVPTASNGTGAMFCDAVKLPVPSASNGSVPCRPTSTSTPGSDIYHCRI